MPSDAAVAVPAADLKRLFYSMGDSSRTNVGTHHRLDFQRLNTERRDPAARRRLRPVAHVIARVRELDDLAFVGFVDRSHGPMECPLSRYVPVAAGGGLSE